MTFFVLAIAHKPLQIHLIFPFLFIIFLATNHGSGFQYEVGGDKGWVKPDGSELEPYNEWARQRRFHIGDTLYFNYSNDSVLLVTKDKYDHCSVSHPLQSFDNGSTVFKFDHSGFFFFISGKPGHCESGQKLIVRVVAPSSAHYHTILSSPAPSPRGPTGDDKGGSTIKSWSPAPSITGSLSSGPTNSANKLSVASCFLTIIMAVVMVLYLFMD